MFNVANYLVGSAPTIETVRASVIKAVTDASGDMLMTVSDVVPIVMTVIIAVMVVSFGISLFLGLSGKAKA